MERPQAEWLIEFLEKAGKLKSVPRHCITPEGVRETVAGHCWRVSLMAWLLKEELPDVFVPADTTGVSRYLSDVTRTQFLYDYTFDFMDRHRPEMTNLKDYKQIQNYLKSFDLVNEMANYAARRGLKRDEKGIKESYQVLRTRIEAFIARHTIDDEGFYPILGQIDNTLQEAIKQ